MALKNDNQRHTLKFPEKAPLKNLEWVVRMNLWPFQTEPPHLMVQSA